MSGTPASAQTEPKESATQNVDGAPCLGMGRTRLPFPLELLHPAFAEFDVAMSSERDADKPAPQAIARALLAWHSPQTRPFPWRRNRDPYVVWVSETMLQQTQIATVIPYLERWLARFPTVESLAAAPLEEVLKVWEGLGYYARARNLHRAAQIIVERYGGRIPDEREALLALPGIGPYTAGAILSLSYGQDEPVLDGNVRRVLSRVFGVEGDPRRSAVTRELWALARSLIVPGQARSINEALMDLGREVCTPRSPRCDLCPLADLCVAHREGKEESLPARSPRRTPPHYTVTAGVVWNHEGRILLTQRPLEGLLGGLWEFPGGKVEPGETLEDCLRRELKEELDIDVEVGELVGVVNHAYSHFRITLYAFHCRLKAGTPKSIGVADWRWVRLEEIRDYPLSRADVKVLELLEARHETE